MKPKYNKEEFRYGSCHNNRSPLDNHLGYAWINLIPRNYGKPKMYNNDNLDLLVKKCIMTLLK